MSVWHTWKKNVLVHNKRVSFRRLYDVVQDIILHVCDTMTIGSGFDGKRKVSSSRLYVIKLAKIDVFLDSRLLRLFFFFFILSTFVARPSSQLSPPSALLYYILINWGWRRIVSSPSNYINNMYFCVRNVDVRLIIQINNHHCYTPWADMITFHMETIQRWLGDFADRLCLILNNRSQRLFACLLKRALGKVDFSCKSYVRFDSTESSSYYWLSSSTT